MKVKSWLPLLLLVLVISACGPSKKNLSEQITSLEKSVYSADPKNFKESGDTLLTLYTRFIQKYPEDSMTIKYTFNAASIAMNLDKSKEALDLFDRFIVKYPQNPRAPVCLFFKGFIFENQIKDLDKAREIYLSFLEKYPNNDFADDARSSLANLGKSPEEMVAAFEKKQKADSARIADSVRKIKGYTKK